MSFKLFITNVIHKLNEHSMLAVIQAIYLSKEVFMANNYHESYYYKNQKFR